MPRYIIKLEDYYFEYSTIVDAPITFGMSLNKFRRYYERIYGLDGLRTLPDRLNRVEQYGTSDRSGSSAKCMLLGNRAGPNETELTIDEIIKAYCLQEPIKNGWLVPVYD